MPNLIFLHGFLGHPQEFKFLMDSFEKDFECVAIDLTGSNSFSLKSQAEFVKSKIDQMGIKKAHFWGYSMGGRVLLELYRYFPEVFLSATLESTSLGISNVDEKNERVKKDSEWAELINSDPKLFLEKWYSQSLFENFRKHEDFPIYTSLRRKNLSSLHAQIIVEASPGANPDHFSLISNITIPVLALVGQFDDKYLQNWGKLIDKHPSLAIEIIKNSGHVIHLENPEGAIKAFNKKIKAQGF